ncbi:MAG: trypsin-like serine protease [Myxococcales bacterium]|nr:MAG: trypsin-like serine protease [Myxococcales bacterium]
MSLFRLVLLLPLCAACGEAARGERLRQAVYGGMPAPDDDAIVAVVNFAGGQCSGSLLTPTLVLTARHCVASTGTEESAVVCGRTRFDPPDSAGAVFVVARPTITDDVHDYLAVADIRMPEGSGDDLCGTDVVLLRLAEPLSGIAPVEPRLDSPVISNEPYSAVGFGVDASVEGEPSGERKRRDDLQVQCRGQDCEDPDVRDNEWVGSGGPCSGDSGGPALDAQGLVVGVVSRGKGGCAEPVFGDVATRAAWLRSEAIAAAELREAAPPRWAPCGVEEGCREPLPTEEGPAESCSLSRLPDRSVSAPLAVLGVFARWWRRRRKLR